MAIVVEDGSVVTGANSYVSTSDFTAFALARGVTITTAETLLIQAMDYIESLEFIGTRYSSDQALQWPRSGVYIDGFARDYDDIPAELIKGQMVVAMAINEGTGPLINVPRQVASKTVGPISVTYMQGSSSVVINRQINAALWKLLSGSFAGFTVSKA